MYSRIRSALLALTGTALILAACARDNPVAPLAVEPGALFSAEPTKKVKTARAANAYKQTKKLGKAGGKFETGTGHVLVFPEGALDADIEITMERLEGTHIQFEFQPHGLTFPAGAEPVLTLSYANAEEPNLATLAIVYLDADGIGIAEVLATTLDTEKQTLTARLRHFSGYAIAD